MTIDLRAYRNFEQAGWANNSVCLEYEDYFSELTKQSIDSLLDAAAVGSGTTVLDVACGAGYAAGAAIDRGAIASGVDFSPAMITMARSKYPQAEFKEADADSLPFEPKTLDSVVNNFGMPHLPDPQAATREAFRVLVPGGRFAFTAWDVPQKSVAFGAVFGAVQALGNMNVSLPQGPNYFLLSNQEQCTNCMTQAGFIDVQIDYHLLHLQVTDPDMVFDGIARGTVRAAALLQGQDAETLVKIREAVRKTISSFAANGRFEVPMSSLLVSGVKPLF